MTKFKFILNSASDIPKYRQLIGAVSNAIAKNELHINDVLPSVNKVCEAHGLSRDTVFKAYSVLKDQGIIQSVPNKGYFVAKETRKVFLLLDTLKAYKEVLYDAFTKNLPDNVIVDVHFHHYNIDTFSTLIQDSVGKYSKFIIMPFDNLKIKKLISNIPEDKLLLIDWKVQSSSNQNIVYQDFGIELKRCLERALDVIKKYKKFNFIFPHFTNHPKIAIRYFEKFCKKHEIPFEILHDPENFEVVIDEAYLSVSDRMLGRFLKQCKEKELELGIHVGMLSYNETPMKQFINKGVSVISTDFEMLGQKAAAFVTSDEKLHFKVPTTLTLRASI